MVRKPMSLFLYASEQLPNTSVAKDTHNIHQYLAYKKERNWKPPVFSKCNKFYK